MLHRVLPEHSAALRPFFTDPPPNDPMVRAFLAGRAPGQAFIDDLRAPQGCVVAMNYSFVFFGGVPAAKFQYDALQQLRREQTLHVVWKGGRKRLPYGAVPDRIVRRIEFRRRTPRPATAANGNGHHHPGGWANGAPVRRIDATLLKRCLWRDEVVRAAGSVSEFFAHGFGFCTMVGDEIAAEAYACFWGDDRVEIAAITHPDFRQRGHATLVCTHLIEACETLGMATYWSCDADNEPSLRLAARLGFTDPRDYRLLRYDRQPAEHS